MRAYLDLVRQTLEQGTTPQRATVQGQPITTRVLPGGFFQHDLSLGFPLLTTKRIAFRLVTSELEFFLQGQHRKERLQAVNNHIWDEWQAPGQDDPNELGPIYGVQWRGWSRYLADGIRTPAEGAPYKVYRYDDIDQLQNLLDTLRTNPFDRRTVVTAWNPAEIHKMALPPCHMIWQTVTTVDDGPGDLWSRPKRLHLCMTMRSADLMVGVPFNVASYALLLLLLAKHAGMRPGTLSVTLNNCHIYENHVEAALEQLERQPRILPEVEIPDPSTGEAFDIRFWTHTQILLKNYNPHPPLKMEVAV
jgi:thymidylate synthase